MANGDTTHPPHPEGGDPQHGFWWKTWQVLKVVQARLRFVAILVAVGTLLAYWETLNNYYEKWTRPLAGTEEVASAEVEFFCPMHPYIVRDNAKEKCPICHMDLARRKKGSGVAEPLPAGTVSRVQLSPYRVVLAGVQTTEVEYRPLRKEIAALGSVEFNETTQRHIAARQKGRILKLNVNYTGQLVEKGEELATLDVRYSPELTVTLDDLIKARKSGNKELEAMARKRLELWDLGDEQVNEFVRTGKVTTQLVIRSPIRGHVVKKFQREGNYVDEGTPLYDVADLDTVWVEAQVYESDQGLLREGLIASATTLSLPNEVFSGKLTFVYPHLDESSRTLTARFELPNPGHRLRPGMYANVRIGVPPQGMNLFAEGEKVDPDGPRARLDQGFLLAVPENAVIDTGSVKVVYRESSPNVYDGVAVVLGPRMAEQGTPGTFYPVLSGLKAKDRVVTNGSFLVDAETRLNPAAGSIYFGGSGGKDAPATPAVRPSTPPEASEENQKLAAAQRLCPVTGKPLGSMGLPVRVSVKDVQVLLCCDGCREKALKDPDATIKKVAELKGKPGPNPVPPKVPPAAGADDAKIRAALAVLSPEDRALAEGQKYCAVLPKNRLGSMGRPHRTTVGGKVIFLCCEGCEDGAKEDPVRTLRVAEELRAKARAEAAGKGS
ncbi:MAG: efflux RND transporter periplasmic adaptor subunit [Gemmataceae bacterium]